MSTIKNALAALKRNKGRNAFIAIIMLVIITISCIALIINNTANTIRDEQKAKFGSKVSIQLSEEALKKYSSITPSTDGSTTFASPSDMPALDTALLLQLANSEHVKETLIETGFSATSDTLKPVEKKNTGGGTFSSSVGGGSAAENMPTPDYTVNGYSKNQESTILSSRNRKLIDGVAPKGLLDCLISDELAKQNDLKVGDSISIKALSYDTNKPSSNEMNLTISGIYQSLPSSDSNSFFIGLEDIYMLYDETIAKSYNNNAYINTTYYLNSPDQLDAFTSEARSLDLSEDFSVTTDETSYQQVVGPIDGMAQISLLFLLVVLTLGGALLVLLTIMNVRDRNYEIGILRSLGMRKQHVILQMIMEPIVIVACMFVVGCGLGTMIAQPISDNLLENQISKNEQSQMGGGFIMVSSTQGELESIDEMKVSLDETTVAQVFGISILLVILSGLISSLYIVKYEPMEILSERR